MGGQSVNVQKCELKYTERQRKYCSCEVCGVFLCCGAVSPAEGGDLLPKHLFFLYCLTSVLIAL